MAWSSSHRRAQLPDDWQALRAETRRRAGGRCQHVDKAGQRCIAVGTDCDHIDRHAGDGLGNLQWLCRAHHQAKSTAEGVSARAARRARLRLPVERHPGLL